MGTFKSKFETELTELLNRHSMENGSNTPDYILAKYLIGCLDVFEQTIQKRDTWTRNGNMQEYLKKIDLEHTVDAKGVVIFENDRVYSMIRTDTGFVRRFGKLTLNKFNPQVAKWVIVYEDINVPEIFQKDNIFKVREV